MNPFFLLSGLGMMAVALLVVFDWRRHAGVPWSPFLWGGLAWIVAIALKGIGGIPTDAIRSALEGALPKGFAEPVLWIYIGLLTGVFECGVTLAFARMDRIRSQGWEGVVAFGLGFGAIEAFLVGLTSFVMVLLVWRIPDKLPQELLQQALNGPQSTLVIPASVLERINAIFLHAFASLLIVYAVQTGRWRWFWVSFLYKTAIDAAAGYLYITYGIENLTTRGMWAFEIANLPFGIVGVWGLVKFRERYREREERGEVRHAG